MAIMSVGKDEIDQMIEEGNPIEVKCHFCNTAYNFSIDDLKHLRELCEKRR
jgi:molecular chaperone Hsp33